MFRSIQYFIPGLVTFFILVYFSHSAPHAAELSQTTQLLPPLINSQPKRIFVVANDPSFSTSHGPINGLGDIRAVLSLDSLCSRRHQFKHFYPAKGWMGSEW